MQRKAVLITGCSCGGKSTLVQALAAKGFATVPEPGRRIVAEELSNGGNALPWVDPKAFARRAVTMARADLAATQRTGGSIFFDRGLIDAAVGLAHCGGPSIEDTLGQTRPYDTGVFVAPPWPVHFEHDAERKHSFDEALQEYHRIVQALERLGYSIIALPQVPVQERTAFVLKTCGAASP